MQLPQFRVDRIEDGPLHTRVTVNARGLSDHTADTARISSYINCSTNAPGQHIKQIHYRLKEEFERRHLALLRECNNNRDPRVANLGDDWRVILKHVLPGPLMLFRVPKV